MRQYSQILIFLSKANLVFNLSNGLLLWFKYQREGNAYHQSEGCEDKPAGLPLTHEEALLLAIDHEVLPSAELVNNLASSQRTNGSTNAVGHHHEQTLSRSLDLRVAFLVDEDTARDIEEVKGDTVNDTREDEEDNTRHSGISYTEEAETEDPCEKRHQHYHLDTETLQEERNHQDAQGLRSLQTQEYP